MVKLQGLCATGVNLGDEFRTLSVSKGQPQVSKHLRVLKDAGLVVSSVDAQRRLYELRSQRFQELDEWLEPYRSYWNARLDDLETHLDDS